MPANVAGETFALAEELAWTRRHRARKLVCEILNMLLLLDKNFLSLILNENKLFLNFLWRFFFFIWLPSWRILGFKSEQYLALWISDSLFVSLFDHLV